MLCRHRCALRATLLNVASSFDAVAMGKRIEDLALRRGLSLRDIGTLAGVGISTMSRIVNGRMPLVSVEIVVRLCIALDVRLEWLVLDTGPIKRPPS